MALFICKTCGTQFPESDEVPDSCPICEDERQYIGANGQEWTTLDQLRGAGYRNEFKTIEPGITGIGTLPSFAIGQRAMLIQTAEGNILWDCVSYIDEETVETVDRMGGIAAIAISHAHFYSSMVEWSARFDSAPIYLHELNRPWVMRPDEVVNFWDSETISPLPGVTLIRCGGHFPGSTVLHWAPGAEGRGSLHTGDTISVAADKRMVSFMYSYPNRIPLAAYEIRRIANAVRPFQFHRLYAGWWDSVVDEHAKRTVLDSAERIARHIEG
ncbi:MAG TPA: MBL fold metallo-hydrolase [Spirochaetia bacterium]|nr:MBL fold metallo-hydrolase [Spirochaetia bacterium]